MPFMYVLADCDTDMKLVIESSPKCYQNENSEAVNLWTWWNNENTHGENENNIEIDRKRSSFPHAVVFVNLNFTIIHI